MWTCPPPMSEMENEWTFKCPPKVVRMLSHNGSGCWGMEKLLLGQGSMLMNQNTWSPSTSNPSTHSTQPPPCHSGSRSSSKPREGHIMLWLQQPMPSKTLLPMQKSNATTTTMSTNPSSKWTDEPSSPDSIERMKNLAEYDTAWKDGGSINDSATSKTGLTSITSYPTAPSFPVVRTHATTVIVDQKVHHERGVMLPPEHTDKLLPWWCH